MAEIEHGMEITTAVKAATKLALQLVRDKAMGSQTRRLAREFMSWSAEGRVANLDEWLYGLSLVAHLSSSDVIAKLAEAANFIDGPKQTGAGAKPRLELETQSGQPVAPNPPSWTTESCQEEAAELSPRAAVVPVRLASVAQVIAQEKGRHLGDLCGWSLSGNRRKDAVDALAMKYNLQDDLEFPKLTPNSAYRKAIQQVFKGKAEGGKAMAVLVEDNPDKIVHSIVTSKVINKNDGNAVSARDATFATEFKVGFSKIAYTAGASASGCLMIENESFPQAAELRTAYMELTETYLHDDIRSAFQRAFGKWGACPVLPHGGLWYVPSVYAEKVRTWSGFLLELGMKAIVIPIFDTAETIKSLQEAARAGLEGQLADLVAALESYARNTDKVRISTLEKRMADFDELRNRAELYQSILGVTVEDIKQKVKTASEELRNSLALKDAKGAVQ